VEWPRYKALCDQPDYWSRWMLEQCIELFRQQGESALIEKLDQALQGQPLATPADHRGHRSTQMFLLDMSPRQRALALAAVQRGVSSGLTTSGTAERGLAGFVEAWREYAEHAA